MKKFLTSLLGLFGIPFRQAKQNLNNQRRGMITQVRQPYAPVPQAEMSALPEPVKTSPIISFAKVLKAAKVKVKHEGNVIRFLSVKKVLAYSRSGNPRVYRISRTDDGQIELRRSGHAKAPLFWRDASEAMGLKAAA